MEMIENTVTRLDDELGHNIICKSMEEYFRVPGRGISRKSQETWLVDEELASHVCILSVGDKGIWKSLHHGISTFSQPIYDGILLNLNKKTTRKK